MHAMHAGQLLQVINPLPGMLPPQLPSPPVVRRGERAPANRCIRRHGQDHFRQGMVWPLWEARSAPVLSLLFTPPEGWGCTRDTSACQRYQTSVWYGQKAPAEAAAVATAAAAAGDELPPLPTNH